MSFSVIENIRYDSVTEPNPDLYIPGFVSSMADFGVSSSSAYSSSSSSFGSKYLY